MLPGKKTYLIAAIIFVGAVIDGILALGEDLSWEKLRPALGGILVAAALAALRAGVAKNGTKILLPILLLPILVGCATTPTQEWGIAAESYTAALKTLTTLKNEGLLTDEDKAEIEPVRKTARAALDAMELRAVAEDPSGMDDFKTVFDVALAGLKEWISTGLKGGAE
jgi:hypothetical protein